MIICQCYLQRKTIADVCSAEIQASQKSPKKLLLKIGFQSLQMLISLRFSALPECQYLCHLSGDTKTGLSSNKACLVFYELI